MSLQVVISMILVTKAAHIPTYAACALPLHAKVGRMMLIMGSRQLAHY